MEKSFWTPFAFVSYCVYEESDSSLLAQFLSVQSPTLINMLPRSTSRVQGYIVTIIGIEYNFNLKKKMKTFCSPTTVRETVVSDGKHNRQVLYGTFFCRLIHLISTYNLMVSDRSELQWWTRRSCVYRPPEEFYIIP